MSATGTTETSGPAQGPAGGGAWRTLALGVGVAAAFVVGAAIVTVVAEPRAAEPPDDIPVVQTPVPLASRVPPLRQAPLPDLVLDGFDGAPPVDLAAYRGRPLVVNLWATWCPPCVEEMPDIERVAAELDGEVAVLGVNVRDAPANAADFAADLGIGYDLAADPRGELYAAVEAFGMPTTLLVTAEGTIVYRHTGLLDATGLRALVREHLGAGSAAQGSAGWRPATALG